MKKFIFRNLFLISCICLTTSSGFSQSWTEEQNDVWNTIAVTWDAITAQDVTWLETYIHPSFLEWSAEFPMPRDKSSHKKWHKFSWTTSKTLIHELKPVGIVVEGSTAVAHYYYSIVTENKKGERKTIHGRYTDILILEDGKWLYIAWSGGQDKRLD